jgi:dCTP diphosphatase
VLPRILIAARLSKYTFYDDNAYPSAGWDEKDREHLGEEMADVLLYLVRLADRCGVNLPLAAIDKMKKNAAKYPADKAKGRSDKYTAYNATTATSETSTS